MCVCMCACVCAQFLSHVQFFMTLWTVVCQASLSTGFSRQNTRVDCHFLHQGIFPTQGWSPHILNWQADSLPPSHQGNPCIHIYTHTAKSAKSLQSCPTLCDPIDSSPPGSPVPGILQARTLEWVAISFSNAWKGKVKVKSLLATSWTAAYQAPPSMGFSPIIL